MKNIRDMIKEIKDNSEQLCDMEDYILSFVEEVENLLETKEKENDDLIFLKELQEELREQETDCQASPRFWVVGDYRYVASYDGCGDRFMITLPSTDYHFEISEYVNHILEENSSDYSEEQLDELKSHVLFNDKQDILDWCRENDDENAYLTEEIKEHYTVPSTFFITKQEAIEHIKANKHHYTSEAHTYAMTAWRAPKVERLIKILENLNWENLLETKEKENDDISKYTDIEDVTVYRLSGADVMAITKEEGYNLSHKQMREVINFFERKFEIENWSEYVKVTLQTYFQYHPSKDITGKDIEF